MGGKTKQSQRTKNNVRPSSSGRSAELLGNINMDFSLLKLSMGNGQSTLFPTLTTINLDQGLHPDFQICIKKLNKKDPITKAKALQELCELVSSNKVEDVVAVLPSWAHFYKILTVDTDRKVRENTQLCQTVLMGACGRRAAPQLKQLLPAWLQALHDEHAPAQTYARTALEKTFPDKKLPEVLSFCRAEIMSHLVDSLIGNVESVLTKKSGATDSEEQELKEFHRQRVVASSLCALEYLALHLPAAHGPWLWAELAPLLQSSLFWNFPTHKHDPIRAAWFAATGRLIERFKTTFGEKYGTRTVRVLLGPPREPNALVAANLWACLLQLMHSLQDWYQYLEKKELLIKRILDILQNGGWGDARHLSNLLLPLLAHLPPHVFHKEFYQSFFNAIYVGLNQKNIWSSKSERQSWIRSLADCIRYLSIQEHEFVVEVVTAVHRSWLQEVLCGRRDPPVGAGLLACSATNMAALLKYWLKQAAEQNSPKYEQLIRNFWQNIGATISAQIDGIPTSPEHVAQHVAQHVDHQVLLLKTLKRSFLQDPKRLHSIKFECESEVKQQEPLEVKQKSDELIHERYRHNLEELVQTMCSRYLELVRSGDAQEPLVPALHELLVEFDSRTLFLRLADHFHLRGLYDLYDTLLRPWLLDDAITCKPLLDIVFLLLNHMTQEEQRRTMDTFQQLQSAVREWCVCAAVATSRRGCVTAREWARGVTARDTLAALCRRSVGADASAAPADTHMLLQALAVQEDGEVVVGPESVAAVLQIVCEALHPDSPPQGGALAAAAALASALPCASPAVHHACSRLLLQLFLLTCHIPRGDPRLPPRAWADLVSAWRGAVATLSHHQRLDFLSELAGHVRTLLFQNCDGLNVNKIERITCLCPYLLSKDSTPPDDLQLPSTLTRNLVELDVDSLEPFALHHDCISGNLNCPFEEYEYLRVILEGHQREMSKPEVVRFLTGLLFRAMYLKAVLLHKDADADADADVDAEDADADAHDTLWSNHLLADEQILMELCRLFYDYSIVCSLYEGYTFWHHYHLIEECKEELEGVLTDIVRGVSAESRGRALRAVAGLAGAVGYYWAYARRHLEALSECGGDGAEPLDLTALEQALTGNGFFHTLQAGAGRGGSEPDGRRARFLLVVRSLYLAHGAQLEPVLVRELVAAAPAADLTVVVNAYFRHNHLMLYETDVAGAPWNQVVSNAAILDFLTHLVTHAGWDAPAHWWDFTTITLCSLMSSLEKSVREGAGVSVQAGVLARALSRLYVAVARFVAEVPDRSTRRTPAPHVAHLPAEWRDMFAPDLHSNLLHLLLRLLDGAGCAAGMDSSRAALTEGVLRCLELMPWREVPGLQHAETLCRVRDACCACMLETKHLACQSLACGALALITDPLVLHDAEILAGWSGRPEDEEECERPALSIEHLGPAYEHLQAEAVAALAGCDSAGAGAAAWRTWAAWLGAAEALHALCGRARDDLHEQVMQVYRARGYADPLLDGALRLVPRQLAQHAFENTSPTSPHYQAYFLEAPRHSVYGQGGRAAVERLACRALWWAVSVGGGAGARGWLVAAPARLARLLTFLVRTYISSHLVHRHLEHLQRHVHELTDAEVRIRWSCNEVSCEFPVEDRRIEVFVWFARDHPLGVPRAAGPSSCGPILNTGWIILYLAHQNGTLVNALQMWMQAISSRIESSPQCYICYCRLEGSTGRLPGVRCRQCRNRFHYPCLRKWFATSKKSLCPLCRNTF